MKSTLFDKVWDAHVVRKLQDGPDVLFIDRHLIHEVTSSFSWFKTTWNWCLVSGTYFCNGRPYYTNNKPAFTCSRPFISKPVEGP